ncbi:MAG: DUF1501 domain-containing protein [Angustibacter sp.]
MDTTSSHHGLSTPTPLKFPDVTCDCEQQPADPWKSGFTRRRVMQGSAALVAALGLQTVTTRLAFAANPATDTDTIITINLRGGWDSLNIVVPTFESIYYSSRPNIAIPKEAALPLARGFGLHPALRELHGLYQARKFAPVVGVVTPDVTLSHFEAMDTLERGTASGLNTSGWMNRALKQGGASGVFSGVQFGAQLPLALTGDASSIAITGLQSFGLAGYDDLSPQAAAAFTSLYSRVDHPMTSTVGETLGAVRSITDLRTSKYEPGSTANYPEGQFGDTLKDTARLIRAGLGLSLAAIDIGGWDMHTGEGNVGGGDLRNHMVELDAGLGAFVRDLGDDFNNVTIVLISEFGRSLAENGTNGTDHGHGQSMLVLGGQLNGGQVYGDWPGLAADRLSVNGSVGGTVDYRDVLGDVLARRGGIGSFTSVFPDHRPSFLGIARQR